MSAILDAIGFHEIVERTCGDGGELPVSYLEASIHCRYNRVDSVPLSQFEDWVGNLSIPVWVAAPADKLHGYRLGRVMEMVGPNALSLL